MIMKTTKPIWRSNCQTSLVLNGPLTSTLLQFGHIITTVMPKRVLEAVSKRKSLPLPIVFFHLSKAMLNILRYIDGAIYRLKYWLGTYGEDGKNEINTICHGHVIIMDVDLEKRFSYTGVDVHDGKLRIFFGPTCLGTNVDNSLENLEDALNKAPQPAAADGSAPKLSSAARLGIKQEYDPKIEAAQKKLAEMFGIPEFKLNPRFEENYAILKENEKSASLDANWDKRLGEVFRKYFEGAEYYLKYQKFDSDDMLQEGFNEEVSKHEIAIRVVDKLTSGSYNESVIEDGILYMQVCTVPSVTICTSPKDYALRILALCYTRMLMSI